MKDIGLELNRAWKIWYDTTMKNEKALQIIN